MSDGARNDRVLQDEQPWLQAHCAHVDGGGWAAPIRVKPDHPLLGCLCFACGAPIAVDTVVIPMRYHGREVHGWIVQHRACIRDFNGPDSALNPGQARSKRGRRTA
jgi:hypothetical protein